MALYDQLKTLLQSKVYQNSAKAITGAEMQSVLMSFINTLGTDSSFMGMLSNGNKPTGEVDGKQLYVGINSGSDITIDLTSVGLGTLTLTKSNLWIVYHDGTGWHATDLAAGLATAIVPGSGTCTIRQNNEDIGRFGANQSANSTINLPTTRVSLIDTHGQVLGTFYSAEKLSNPVSIVIPIGGSGGGVSSVGLSMPVGFSVSGSPVTSSGTLAVSFATGYGLPTLTQMSSWDTAYNSINKEYHDNGDPDDDTLTGDGIIRALKPNRVYYIDNATSLEIQSYDYDDSSFECTGYPETYIIVDAASAFQVDVSLLPNVNLVRGTDLYLDAGRHLIIVRGNIWEHKTIE